MNRKITTCWNMLVCLSAYINHTITKVGATGLLGWRTKTSRLKYASDCLVKHSFSCHVRVVSLQLQAEICLKHTWTWVSSIRRIPNSYSMIHLRFSSLCSNWGSETSHLGADKTDAKAWQKAEGISQMGGRWEGSHVGEGGNKVTCYFWYSLCA